MGVRPEEEATRIDFWGQDGQCQGSVLLSPTFQEGQVPMGPSPKDHVRRQVCVAHGDRGAGASCVTGYEWENLVRQVGPCVWGLEQHQAQRRAYWVNELKRQAFV